MTLYPPAKLNLGLYVTAQRPDGYHLLETIFLPIALRDSLTITRAVDSATDLLVVDGVIDTGSAGDNLVLRAVRALRERYEVPPLELHLSKVIPSGAGMGGGSSDASYTLRGVNELLSLGAERAELAEMALRLGADCPFFVQDGPAVGRGIGEVLTPISLPQLRGYWLSLVKPPVHSSTAEAFRGLGRKAQPARPIESLIAHPVTQWRELLRNDFEASLFPRYPELAQTKERLYQLGADFALMTGSGSTIYALSRKPLPLDEFRGLGYFTWQELLP